MTITISEFNDVDRWGQYGIPNLTQPAVAIPGTSAAIQFENVRFVSDVDVRIAFGINPVADADSEPFIADTEYSRKLPVGTKFSVVVR